MKSLILFVLFLTPALADNLKLIGSHLLEVTVFGIDVYKASYYQGGENEKIKLKYLRDVEKKYSVEGWEKSLKKYDSSEEKKARKWLIETSSDKKEGDVLEIIKEDNTIRIVLNGKVTHQSNDKIITKLALAPWVGQYPAKEEMKKDLLGK